MPRFSPRAGKEAIREAIGRAGMRLSEEAKVKRFYRLFRDYKN